MDSFGESIRASLNNLATHKGIRFTFELTFLAFLLKLAGYFPTYYFFEALDINQIFDKMIDMQIPAPNLETFAYAVVIAPFLETIFGQIVPISITKQFTDNNISKILISAIVFSLFHVPAIAFMPSAFLMGLLLAWVYVVKGREDWKMGILYTFAVHAVHNLLSFIFTLLPFLN